MEAKTRETTTSAKRGTNDKRSSKLRITFTTVNGLLFSMDIKDHLKIYKPDIFCIAETKLKEGIHINSKKEGYRIWKKDRKGKGGGGVLIIVQEDIFVEGVQYGDGMAEVIWMTIRTS